MKRMAVAFLVVLTMIYNSASLAFSDVSEGHWAKKSIDAMVEQGIISGYEDGTFRPSRNISKIESLILLSKMAGVNKYSEAASIFETKYANDLKEYTTSYKKQVSYLMGVGVLQIADLEGLLSKDEINSSITREEMAVLITKLLGKESEVKKASFVALPFADAEKITKEARPYVEFVYNEGIMKGVDEKNFSPNTFVTRAQAAGILNSIRPKVNIVPEVANNKEKTIKGEITTIATGLSIIWVEDEAGIEDGYEYNSSTKIYVNSETVKDSDLEEGMKVELTVKDEIITKLYAESEEETAEESDSASGKITAIKEGTSQSTVSVKVGSTVKTYIITSDTDLYIDDEDADLNDFDVDDEVDLELDGDEVVEMSMTTEDSIDTGSDSISGTIVSITLAKEKILTIESNNKTKSYIITSDTEYYIDDEDADLSDFEIDDEVELELDSGEILEMYMGAEAADSNNDTYVIGTVTKIDTSAKTVTVETDDEDTKVVYISTSSCEILDAVNADYLGFKDLYKNGRIAAFGNYKSSKFYATVVVLIEE